MNQFNKLTNQLNAIASQLVTSGKGILAADESTSTIKKRFDSVGIPDTPENHRAYREILFTTSGIEEFISGVILFEETLRQTATGPQFEGKSFPKLLEEKGIVPGIKVDQGLEDFPDHEGEKYTKGIEDLTIRLKEYKTLGAKFTKWRAVFVVNPPAGGPSDEAIEKNSETLAEFARISQAEGFVPIVEPEVLMDGKHTMNDSEIATTRVLKKVFEKLSSKEVDFSGMLLKPNWVHPGLELPKPTNKEVAEATLRVLKATVPHEVPGIVFLSGGDSPDDATEHLNALNEVGVTQPDGKLPWELSFSFGRALQSEALKAWKGESANTAYAQQAFYERAKKVSRARLGKLTDE